jgi:Reverse transcriptase (RNA-dependent DNA polymerase)
VNLPVHDAATAYEHGRGIRFNAERHKGSRFLLRMDFEAFFPSLQSDDVEAVLNKPGSRKRLDAGWSQEDTYLVTSLVCRFQRLVIGAPTSPKISNAICFEMDEQLLAMAKQFDVIYTRYADDLFFSSTEPNLLRKVQRATTRIIKNLKTPSGLKLNKSKTRHSSMRGRRVVTGLILANDGSISIGRHKKRFLRSLVHRYPELTVADQLSIRGWLAYCGSIEPDFLNSLAGR